MLEEQSTELGSAAPHGSGFGGSDPQGTDTPTGAVAQTTPASPAPVVDPPAGSETSERVLNLRPDAPDLRDRMYMPALSILPKSFNLGCWDDPDWQLLIHDQGEAPTCAGFALATLIEVLHRRLPQSGAGRFSPFMLYYMACVYDEIPGLDLELGTTARAAMKAWSKNGACRLKYWAKFYRDSAEAGTAWLTDAFRTPLGAYYRVDHREIPDLHAALNDVGVVFCTAQIHGGWHSLSEDGTIPYQSDVPIIGGHAFLLVGYDEQGFWVMNSWGDAWGKKGFAHLTYADWRANAMDTWVAQIGVYVSHQTEHLQNGLTSKDISGPALLASDPAVSTQQVNAYVIDIENNGVLSSGGQFHTTDGDLKLLFTTYLNKALQDWGLSTAGDIKVALFAHGGLDNEAAAEAIAKHWIPDLLAARIFPIFFMWETGILETIQDKVADQLHGLPTMAGASFWSATEQRAKDWMDDRFETLVSGVGTPFWEEIKKNAADDPVNTQGGIALMLKTWCDFVPPAVLSRMRLHLIGHSAGALFQGALLPQLQDANLTVEGVHLMAAACRMDFFKQTILPAIRAGRIARYTQMQLTDSAEYHDTCTPLPYYRSLLYLLSNAAERQRGRPLLGMEKFYTAANLTAGVPAGVNWQVYTAPGPESQAMHHGDFSSDELTRRTVIKRIQ